MKIQIIVFLAFFGATLATRSFSRYQQEFNKRYDTPSELAKRQAIFETNLKEIEEHNQKYADGKVTWFMRVNQFTDLTSDEFGELLGNIEMAEIDPETEEFSQRMLDEIHMNSTRGAILDWRQYGIVSPVKYQGICGACAAFTATATLESCFALKTGQIVDLSEQFMVDCGGGLGCFGGNPITYLNFIKNKNSGRHQTEQSYPYTGFGSGCHSNANGFYTGWAMNNLIGKQFGTNENDLLGLVASYGPAASSINGQPLQSYGGGIFESGSCCDAAYGGGCGYNHAVTIVGYGNENGKDYWIGKNSWAPSWGENGFFRIKKGTGHCGLGYQINAIPLC